MRSMRKTKPAIVAAALCAALSATALPALAAEEPTRAEYKTAVEPICKVNTKANENILAGVEGKVKQGKLKAAGHQFTRAAAALQKTLRQLKEVPKPPADEARLTEWLKRVGDQQVLLQKIGKALIGENRHKAETLSVKLYSGARLTNAIVVGFGFNYCRFEPSKYT
jgi:hypothetical protein